MRLAASTARAPDIDGHDLQDVVQEAAQLAALGVVKLGLPALMRDHGLPDTAR